MEDAHHQTIDRFTTISSPVIARVDTGDRAGKLHNMTEQPLPPKDERIVSVKPTPNAAISEAERNVKDQPATLETSGPLTSMYPFNLYTPQEQGHYPGGYDNNSGNRDEHSNYVNANNLQVIPPAMHNENSSFYYSPGYAYDSQMAYGQFSTSPYTIDCQMFSPGYAYDSQIPVAPSYYPPPVSPGPDHVTSAHPASRTELMPSGSSNQESLMDNTSFGPGSGYYLHFGSFGGGDLSGNSGMGFYEYPGDYGSKESLSRRSNSFDTSRLTSPLTSGNVYPQTTGSLGSYEQNVAQAPYQGFGLTSNSSARHFSYGGSYHSSGGSNSYRNRFVYDKGGRLERDRDAVCISTDRLGISNYRNRGPRTSNPKTKSSEEGLSSNIKDVESTSGFHVDHCNSPDFTTDYEHAKFFVIKSFSEDNVHRSIKYSVWSSTSLGNRKLDAAYHEAKEIESGCPVFLFFSVNATGQFCGVAEMVGPVDFEKNAHYWQQDRWSGQFPVNWRIIKDVPNGRFRHILLQNNENKPVTHSRDSQEVKLEQGIEMLKIFKEYDANMSLLDDFDFYDEREKSLLERKAKPQADSSTGDTAAATESVNQLSENLAETLHLDSGENVSNTDLE